MNDLTLMKLQNIKTSFFFEQMQFVFVPLNDAEPDIDMKSIAKIYVWEVTRKKAENGVHGL